MIILGFEGIGLRNSVLFLMVVEKEIPIKVERDFTWWEQTCIKWFPWTLILCTLYLGLKFRKPIWHGIKKIFV
nr:hypothetical protein GPVRGNEL_GPVRGNEL_CDS_0024 [Caudoviricetes sp.]